MNEPPRCVLNAMEELRRASGLVVTACQQRGDYRWTLMVGDLAFGPEIDLYHLVEQAQKWVCAKGAA